MDDSSERPAILMPSHKRIALVAHDSKKDDILEWAEFNLDILKQHQLIRDRDDRPGSWPRNWVSKSSGCRAARWVVTCNSVRALRRGDRCPYLLLGSAGIATPRPGYPRFVAHCRRVEHPGSHESSHGRLFDELAIHAWRV
jgi:hypothetical protein